MESENSFLTALSAGIKYCKHILQKELIVERNVSRYELQIAKDNLSRMERDIDKRIQLILKKKLEQRPRESLVVDILTYLDPDWVHDAVLARGVVTGMVSGLMVAGGFSFELAIAYLVEVAKKRNIFIDKTRLPESWVEEWEKNEVKSQLSQEVERN